MTSPARGLKVGRKSFRRRPKRQKSVIGSWRDVSDNVAEFDPIAKSATRYSKYFAVTTEVDGVIVADFYGDSNGDAIFSPGDSLTGRARLISIESGASGGLGIGTFSHILKGERLTIFGSPDGFVIGTADLEASVWTNV